METETGMSKTRHQTGCASSGNETQFALRIPAGWSTGFIASVAVFKIHRLDTNKLLVIPTATRMTPTSGAIPVSGWVL